eukprot:s180_g48.t1
MACFQKGIEIESWQLQRQVSYEDLLDVFYKGCHAESGGVAVLLLLLLLLLHLRRLLLAAPDRSGHCRTSSASSRSQWALPDFSRDAAIAVGTAGLHLPAPDRRGHCRTSLPDFICHKIAVGTAAGLQPRLPDHFSRDRQIAVGPAGLQPRLPDRFGHCRTSAATSRSQGALPDFNPYKSAIWVHNEDQRIVAEKAAKQRGKEGRLQILEEQPWTDAEEIDSFFFGALER